ncbi:XRE family transcriptional regulator [Paracoccus versutus]|nr:XRE family transcriptional regulator [Paracoccus versutus]
MQAKVRTERLGFHAERWHHANMGLRIKELRKDKGLTGEQLADMVGVSKGYISEIETGKKTPGAGLMMRFADALKCEVYELYEGTLAEQKDAALKAHMGVMAQLEDENRNAIVKAALGLLAKQP